MAWWLKTRSLLPTGVVVATTVAATAGCTLQSNPLTVSPPNEGTSAAQVGDHAVVLVSGLATQTPFTTPADACGAGPSAGDSMSAIRDALVSAGYEVFTAPAQPGPGPVVVADAPGPLVSTDCPLQPAADLTIDTTASIDAGGQHLAAFTDYLRDQYGVAEVDFVGYSMGGLWSRAAIGDLREEGVRVHPTSLVSIGTPWTGTYPADFAEGTLPLTACGSDPTCLAVLPDYKSKLADVEGPDGAANVIGTTDLQGHTGWNVAQGDDLAGIPVTLIGGDHFALPGGTPQVWPNDGIVALDSALARGISGFPLDIRGCLVRPDVHTAALAAGAGLPLSAALTWDPVVADTVAEALAATRSGRREQSDC